jgi:hypothetical protein
MLDICQAEEYDFPMDQTMAIILGAVLLFACIFGPLFGADSRPGWKNVNRKPRPMVSSMRREDWPSS